MTQDDFVSFMVAAVLFLYQAVKEVLVWYVLIKVTFILWGLS